MLNSTPLRKAFDHKSHNCTRQYHEHSEATTSYSHWPVRVDPCVLDVVPHLAEQYLQLLCGPAQNAGEDGRAESVQPRRDVLQSPDTHRRQHAFVNRLDSTTPTKFLVFLVLGPLVLRPLEHDLLDTDETLSLQLLLVLDRTIERPPDGLAALHQVVHPLGGGKILSQRPIVAGVRANIRKLDPTAPSETLVRPLEEARPISQGSRHHAAVDEVKLDVPSPRLLDIVDLEAKIGRHKRALDRGVIRADDRSGGELVGKVDGPDTGTGADVKHIAQLAAIAPSGGQVQLVAGLKTGL